MKPSPSEYRRRHYDTEQLVALSGYLQAVKAKFEAEKGE